MFEEAKESVEVSGYKVFHIKIREESEQSHCLYAKKHRVREKVSLKPSERTLFILGVPPYADKDHLANAFSVFGKVENVFLHSTPTVGLPPEEISKIFIDHPPLKGFKVGYVVFESEDIVDLALEAGSIKPLILSSPTYPVLLGVSKWCQEYNDKVIEEEKLLSEVNEHMAEFDKIEAKETEALKQAKETDDEGWTVVTKKSRKRGFSRKESVINNILHKEEKKKPRKELQNFYRFQIRESKMNHLMKLREKFAEDKKRIALMKQARKFRPY